jgi:hypothetical protein
MGRYTCSGSVCGDCGVMHRTIGAAVRHVRSHGAAVRRASPGTYPTRAYSDRVVAPVTQDGATREWEQWELDELDEEEA